MHETEMTPITTGRHRLLRGRAAFVALLLAVVFVFAACSETNPPDGGGETPPTDPGGEAPPPEETSPPETAPPETSPPEDTSPPDSGGDETPPPDEETDDGLSNEDWLVIALLGAGVLGIILLATSLASNHSEAKEGQRSALNTRLGEITGGARWVHDQGSIDVLRATDTDQLRGIWNGTRGRVVDLEGNIAAFAASVGDPNLSQSLAYLGQSLAGLRGAMETNVTLRLDPQEVEGRDQLLQNSTQTVYDRRQQVQAAIGPVSVARQ